MSDIRDRTNIFDGISLIHAGVTSVTGSAFNNYGGFSITNFTALHQYAGGTQNIGNLERLVLTLIYEINKRQAQTGANTALL